MLNTKGRSSGAHPGALALVRAVRWELDEHSSRLIHSTVEQAAVVYNSEEVYNHVGD